MLRSHTSPWTFARVCLVLGTVLLPAAARADATVYPTGKFPDDVRDVQRAVIAGGIVHLKAFDSSGNPTDFNFGPSALGAGSVLLVGNVELVGENINGRQTTISGGSVPLRVQSAKAAIRGIHLKNPWNQGIRILSSTDVEITGNTITDIVPAASGPLTFANGILAASSNVKGTLLIADNVINGVPADEGFGISISNQVADTRITRNLVANVDLAGILVGVNTSPVSIDGNTVIPGLGSKPDSVGNGILYGHTRGGTAYIGNNTVICENPYADGISILGLGTAPLPENGAVIEKNDITMHGSLFGGISLYDQASDNLVRANKVQGDGAYALQVGTYVPPATAGGNSFIGNNISGFTASVADIFLDVNSHGTIVKGNNGTVVDLGTDDWISGSKRGVLDASLGDRVRREQELKRQILQAVPDDTTVDE